MKIIAATTDHVPIVRDIIHLSFIELAHQLRISETTCPRYVAFESEADIARDLGNGVKIFLLENDGQFIGTVRHHTDATTRVGEIKRLAVLPAWRKRDHGLRLMRHCEDALRNDGVTKIELSVVKQFEKLRRFYTRLGYTETETFHPRSFPFEVVKMTKPVAQAPADGRSGSDRLPDIQ